MKSKKSHTPLFFSFFLLTLFTNFTAGEILSRSTIDGTGLLITQRKELPFTVGEYLCVHDEKIDLACGVVDMSNPNFVLVRAKLLSPPEKLKVGQGVRSAKAPPETATTLNDVNNTKLSDWQLPLYQLKYAYPDKPGTSIPNTPSPAIRRTYMLGLVAHNLNPQIHLQMETDYHHSIGIELGAHFFSPFWTAFQNKNLIGTLVGGCLTFGYYTDGPFAGNWVKGGLGLYRGILSQHSRKGEVNALTGEIFLGRRWSSQTSSYGWALGLQAFSIPHSGFLNQDIQIFVPTLNFEIGIPL